VLAKSSELDFVPVARYLTGRVSTHSHQTRLAPLHLPLLRNRVPLGPMIVCDHVLRMQLSGEQQQMPVIAQNF
jgi:hypothetical protein